MGRVFETQTNPTRIFAPIATHGSYYLNQSTHQHAAIKNIL